MASQKRSPGHTFLHECFGPPLVRKNKNPETFGELIATEALKKNMDFVQKLIAIALPETTLISDVIKHCIDNDLIDQNDLITLPNYVCCDGHTNYSPFQYALLKNKLLIAEEIFKGGMDINSVGVGIAPFSEQYESFGSPAIVFAIYHCDMKAIEFVLNHKPDLDFRWGPCSETPLLIALRYLPQCASLILSAGPNVMLENRTGRDAFDYCDLYHKQGVTDAIRKQMLLEFKIVILDDLVKKQKKIDNRLFAKLMKNTLYGGQTEIKAFIKKCITENRNDIIDSIIIELNVIFGTEIERFELIQFCISGMFFVILNRLFDKWMDLDFSKPESGPLLKTAIGLKNRKLVALLLTKKANVNNQGQHGTTPLMKAIKNEDYDIANKLLDLFANVIPKNRKNVDALDLIEKKEYNFAQENLRKRIIDIIVIRSKSRPEFVMCGDHKNTFKVPKLPKVIVHPCWDSREDEDFNTELRKYMLIPVAGKVWLEMLNDKSEWILIECELPKCYVKNYPGMEPIGHVIPAFFGYISRNDVLVRFANMSYI